jgi:hypothetical protein
MSSISLQISPIIDKHSSKRQSHDWPKCSNRPKYFVKIALNIKIRWIFNNQRASFKNSQY